MGKGIPKSIASDKRKFTFDDKDYLVEVNKKTHKKPVDKREKFLRSFPNIPTKLRESIVVVVDGKPYSWNIAYLEIKNKTKLGAKILKILGDLEII